MELTIPSLALVGATVDLLGKIMVAYTALRVHHRVRQEHKIDKRVFAEMRREFVLGFLGIGLMILGYLLQLPSKW